MMLAIAVLALAAQSAPENEWVGHPDFQAANSAFLDCARRALVAEAASNRSELRAVERAYDSCPAEERALTAVSIRLRGPDLGQRTAAAIRLVFREPLIARLQALRAAPAATRQR